MPRRLPPLTARPLSEAPEPPDWMDAVGRKKFHEVIEYLGGLGAAAAGDVVAVEVYAANYSRWVAAERALASGGDPGWRTVTTRQGEPGSTVPTAMMLQSLRSAEQLRKIGASLGLSPVDRARLPAERKTAAADPVDALFQEVGA